MGDPPDDPGGTVVPPGSRNSNKIDILIHALESSMDTDCSDSNQPSKLKRKRNMSRVTACGTCNKKQRKHCKCEKIDESSGSGTRPLDTSSKIDPESNSAGKNESTHVPVRPVGRTTYDGTDAAPFVVHVQREFSQSNDGTTLHPVTFGRFMKKNDIKGIVNGSLKRIGRNRISLVFDNYSDANDFLTNSSLSSEGYKAFVPVFNVTRMGVIRGVPSDWTDEDVLSNITVPIGCGQILKIRRLRRKVTLNGTTDFVNTGTIVATFDGQVLPTRVYMCFTALPVELYIYPTVQCFNCCRYGHVKNQCRSTPRCYKCGQGHTGESCDKDEDDYWCCLCKGYHQAINKKCIEYERQKAIKETMSKSCISYMEAVKLHPPISKRSYVDALITAPSSSVTGNNHQFIEPQPPQSKSVSYKKTVFMKPRSPPSISKGYDQQKHNELIKNPTLPKSKPILNNNIESQSNSNITDIIKALIQLLSQSSQSQNISPSNVATVIDVLYTLLNNNHGPASPSNSVELSESHQ